MLNKLRNFFKLSDNLLKILSKREKNLFVLYSIGSIFNTVLEIIAIAVIVFLLLLISGQNLDESNLNFFLEYIPFQKDVKNLSIIMMSIVVFKTVYQLLFSYNQEKLSFKIQNRVNIELFKRFINSSYEEHINQKSHKLIRILTFESIRIGNQLISPIITIINEFFLLTFVIIFITYYDPLLGLVFIITCLLLIIGFTYTINRFIKSLGLKFVESNNLRIKIINESFKAFASIKLFNKKESFQSNFNKMTDLVSNSNFKSLFYAKMPKSIFEFFIFFGLFVTIIFFTNINRFDLLISYLSVSAVSIYKVIPSLNKLSNSFQAIQYFSAPFIELTSFINKKGENQEIQNLKEFKSLEYKGLIYKYSNDKVILDKINFHIRKNDFIGILGPSGSGKSTFIKVLSGLLNPQEGHIILNNLDKINHLELRSFFSYVPQDAIILDENIFVNISLNYNMNNIDKERVIDLLKKVNLYKTLENKLEDSLGENGIKISGGQKQRVAIARALYNNKKILVLDESTSNLDSLTESKIIELLKKLSNEITVIIISHKKSSLSKCNKLYRICDNKINKLK